MTLRRGQRRASAAVLACVLGVAGSPPNLDAGTVYWDGGDAVGGNWSAAGNWDPIDIAPGPGDDVVFYKAAAARLTTGVVDGAFTAAIRSLTFGNGQPGPVAIGGPQALTINAGGLTVEAGFGAVTISAPITLGGAQPWLNDSGSPLTVTGAISGSGSLTKTGSGTLAIGAAAAYGGATVVVGGTLKLLPNVVPGGPALWLDAVDPLGTGVLPANGFTVGTWVNKGYHHRDHQRGPEFDRALR